VYSIVHDKNDCRNTIVKCRCYYSNIPYKTFSVVIMAVLRSRCGHYIFALSFLSIYFFFPRLISAVADWISATRLHENTGPKKSPFGHHRTILSGYIFATKARIDNRKKLVKQQYLLHMSSQYGELRPASGWDHFVSLGHPCKFQRLSRLGSVTARRSSIGRQPHFAALNRGRNFIFGRAAITLGIGPHF